MIVQIVFFLAIIALIACLIMRRGRTIIRRTAPEPPNTRSIIDAHLASAPVVIFSKSNCSFCARSKALFSSMGVGFKALELNEMGNGQAIQTTLHQMTNQRTVPNIFVNGEHLGGNDDAQRKAADGSLQRLLNL